MNKTTMTLTAAAVMACAATAAHALPMYTSGSMGVSLATGTTTAVTTTTSFPLSPLSETATSGTGSLSAPNVTYPATLTVPAGALNFLVPADEDFSNTGIGTFTATKATQVAKGTNTATWEVDGTFMPGTDFSNPTATFTADQLYTLNQVGGPGTTISLSYTFFAPSVPFTTVPEPTTLALIGSGLLGVAISRRRKRKS